METIKIDNERMVFLKNSRPFFYFADTAWMAFSNLSVSDWEKYLDYRKMQGFTALQISILPVLNDISIGKDTLLPFAVDESGKMNFQKINRDYFEKARVMTKLAAEKDFTPALVVLWNNYIPTAWAAEHIGNTSLMSEDYLETYAKLVTELFREFAPIYMISGDTRFETETITRYYSKMLEYVKEKNPECLTTMHLSPHVKIPDSIVKSKSLDFYMYQSGHGGNDIDNPWILAEEFLAYPVKRPVINAEPSYEGHGYGGQYPRFSSFEVRRAVWQSLISGAKAGTGYGAHGIWMFQQEGMSFNNLTFSGHPFIWQDALRFKGAWDINFAKWLFEKYDLFGLEPCQDLIEGPKQIRAAAKKDNSLVSVYIPYVFPLKIKLDLRRYSITAFLLGNNSVMKPDISFDGGVSVLKMIPFNEDVLLIAEKEA